MCHKHGPFLIAKEGRVRQMSPQSKERSRMLSGPPWEALCCWCSVTQLCLTLCDPRDFGQHASLPCPSSSPRDHSDSYLLTQWCHPTTSSSVILLSCCLQSFPASGPFLMRRFFASGVQSETVQVFLNENKTVRVGFQSWLGFTVALSVLPIFRLWFGVLTADILCLSLHAYSVLSVTWFFIFFQLNDLPTWGASWEEAYQYLCLTQKIRFWLRRLDSYMTTVMIWELDHKESRGPKNWCFWTVVLEKTLESPLDCKEIQLIHPKGNQSWMFIGRTDAEAEAPILWPLDVKNWLIGKDPDTGKDWRWEEKGMTEDDMVVWHHWLDGHEFEQALRVGDEHGSLACCTPWGHKESDMGHNWVNELNWVVLLPDATMGWELRVLGRETCILHLREYK